MTEITSVRTNLIKVGDRFRKDLGDISILAASIQQLGLLQPIGIDANYRLIFGERRLRAFEHLGIEKIPARFVDVDRLAGEHAENEIRKDFTPVERVAIAKAIEDRLGDRRGSNQYHRKEDVENFPQANGQKTRQIAAKAAGFGNETTYRQAKKVVESGSTDLVEAMDSGDISISAAAKLVQLANEEKMREAKRLVKDMADAKRNEKKTAIISKLDAIAASEVSVPTGLYDAIVIDPPWPMQKIERDERPNQVVFDYPTMSEQELSDLVIPAADDCHVWLWTTQKFLPMALRLLEAWELRYVCTFVWHKPGGFQPIGLPQYNCEFAIYARKGFPSFIDTKAFPTCFNAPRGSHSEKPEEFYDVIRRVTHGRRLDMFNRRTIEGFTGWGQEAPT